MHSENIYQMKSCRQITKSIVVRIIVWALVSSCCSFFFTHQLVHTLPARAADNNSYSATTAFTTKNRDVHVYSPSQYSSNVAVCLIVRNETIYMDEWADFHIALGFSPIYIYDNMAGPDLELELWYERRKDLQKHVRIIYFPTTPVQLAAYDRCIKQDAKNDTFVGLFDVDEFLVLKKHDNVIDFMEEYCQEPKCGQLSINWLVMGTSNETGYRAVPVTKRNVHTDGPSPWVKTIVRPSYVHEKIDWKHTVRLKKGHQIDTRGVIGNKGFHKEYGNEDMPDDVALFHHYTYKSDEEWHYKNCVRGSSLQGRFNEPELCHRQILVQGKIFNNEAWKKLTRMVPEKYGDSHYFDWQSPIS
ncbi:hypothetical protein ACHAW6_001434 [Cyclotella cf. meneghiniana]